MQHYRLHKAKKFFLCQYIKTRVRKRKTWRKGARLINRLRYHTYLTSFLIYHSPLSVDICQLRHISWRNSKMYWCGVCLRVKMNWWKTASNNKRNLSTRHRHLQYPINLKSVKRLILCLSIRFRNNFTYLATLLECLFVPLISHSDKLIIATLAINLKLFSFNWLMLLARWQFRYFPSKWLYL